MPYTVTAQPDYSVIGKGVSSFVDEWQERQKIKKRESQEFDALTTLGESLGLGTKDELKTKYNLGQLRGIVQGEHAKREQQTWQEQQRANAALRNFYRDFNAAGGEQPGLPPVPPMVPPGFSRTNPNIPVPQMELGAGGPAGAASPTGMLSDRSGAASFLQPGATPPSAPAAPAAGSPYGWQPFPSIGAAPGFPLLLPRPGAGAGAPPNLPPPPAMAAGPGAPASLPPPPNIAPRYAGGSDFADRLQQAIGRNPQAALSPHFGPSINAIVLGEHLREQRAARLAADRAAFDPSVLGKASDIEGLPESMYVRTSERGGHVERKQPSEIEAKPVHAGQTLIGYYIGQQFVHLDKIPMADDPKTFDRLIPFKDLETGKVIAGLYRDPATRRVVRAPEDLATAFVEAMDRRAGVKTTPGPTAAPPSVSEEESFQRWKRGK